jgi:hypothetical protein
MKKGILGAALCGAAVALAATANADNNNFLSGSTDALVLGPTGIPTPDAVYISDAKTSTSIRWGTTAPPRRRWR